jgi:hypothetical protein
MKDSDIPDFGFELPRGYRWLLDRGLVGFEANSSLQPWHYLPSKHAFDLGERWPSRPGNTRLFAFAKRQDCDDLACFEVVGSRAERIFVVHGWTPGGYEVDRSYQSFWEWLKSVVDDIAEWVE